ncbi:hypothetical protein EJ06DRAFT_537184 [Trichodelitschia bisporula]|uniref:Integral membrane protein TmpA n=1 Tax=Trichodelitschia bisporula TaxID=703511 RepID=A0A6G1I1D2_9PEZI|nr:hypothetical protein EJ06DRAFT_537184 [Trichodelitschia bisporula]
MKAWSSTTTGSSADESGTMGAYEMRGLSAANSEQEANRLAVPNVAHGSSSTLSLPQGGSNGNWATSTVTLLGSAASNSFSGSAQGETLQIEPYSVPQISAHRRLFAQVRYLIFSAYRCLFFAVFVLNLVTLGAIVLKSGSLAAFTPAVLATVASANLLLAVLIRQDYVLNTLYSIMQLVPHSTPLWIRWQLAKIYECGGIHSASATAGTFWFIGLTVSVSSDLRRLLFGSLAFVLLTYFIIALLCLIVVFALPYLRAVVHNSFEYTHRFASWLTIALFWVELALIAQQIHSQTGVSQGMALLLLPPTWFTAIITVHTVLPWLRLRRLIFTSEFLSRHALRLNTEHEWAPISGIAIARSPLGEWHQFALFPGRDGGSSMIISRSGDWTSSTITGPRPRYWVKGIPKTGFLAMAYLFRRVVIVTTGSGIGPALSFMLGPVKDTNFRVLWSARDPMKTYGDEINRLVREKDPEAVVFDTAMSGRPDMVGLTWKAYKDFGAEAVFVISNPTVTKKVVFEMEARGVPAFGPIFDS